MPTGARRTAVLVTTEATAEIRLFGQVEIVGARGTVSPAGNKQRAVLARLAIDPGRVVTTDELIDDVWGWAPPDSVRSALQVHMSQLRRALRQVGTDDVIRTRAPGYVLELPPSAIDVLRFEHLAAQVSRAGVDPLDVLADADAAEALWLGQPLSALGQAPFADAVRIRLEDRRSTLACARALAAVACGRPLDVVPGIEALALQRPYDEPLWAALARALHAGGRQHDALARLATLRRTLSDDLGLHAGPGIGQLEYEILSQESGRADSMPVVVLDASSRAGLPPTTTLRGRDELLDQIAVVVGEPGLVTLIGPAGVGKTSTAVHAARGSVRRRFEPLFVDLAAVATGQPIEPTVAAALGLRPSHPDALVDELIAVLSDRDQLIVLDNCEHVVAGTAALVDRLRSAPRLTLVATSRVPLGCRHERVIHVEPLPSDVLMELFVERARQASSQFDPEGPGCDSIAELVARLDGLPLGAELIAPLVRSMSPREIVGHADHLPIDLLAVASHHGTSRHRSMGTAISWSVALLSPSQRRLLARLSVFAGGALAPSVVAVCADHEAGTTVDGGEVLGVLRSLVDASLVVAERTPTGTWFRMLFPIREHADRLLRVDGHERATVSARHARHVIELVGEAAALVVGTRAVDGIRAFEQQTADIGRARAWLHAQGDVAGEVDLLAPMGAPGVGAAVALPELSGWLIDAARAADALRLATGPQVVRPSEQGRMWVMLGAAQLTVLEPQTHESLIGGAHELAVHVGDTGAQVVAGALIGEAIGDTDADAGSAHCLAALDLGRQHGDPVIEAFAVLYAANMALRARRLDVAAAVLAEAIAGDTARFGIFEPQVVCQIGRLAMVQGDLAGALSMYQRGERLARATGSTYGVSWAVFGQGEVARRQGRFEVARSLALTSVQLDRVVAPREEWMGLGRLAHVGLRLGDESLLAEVVGALQGRTSRHEMATLEVARGCLAACRGARSLALQHLRRGLEMSADIGAVELFAELVATYGFVVDGDESWSSIGDAVRDRRSTMEEVIARLAS